MPRIEPIRVEMLSTEMPIHQLSKKGSEEIRVLRRSREGGQVDLYWKVEPNLAVGRPGQLAYHLDTWVIRRRLYELPRPIPRLIRIGDLREIARQLGHGGDTNSVKAAFAQNAAAFIRAKLTYRSRGGGEETFEGYFNRYNVFFRGQTLPGGRRAETVYLSLNDPYFGLLNESTWRPLDFEYLCGLAPAAQRFYELVSPRVFAAIKNGFQTAWFRYSDFCLLAVQRRLPTRRRMQIQMAAVHRPHLASGYVADVTYRQAPSPDGLLDWVIHYVPGSRARAEFHTFNGRRSRTRWKAPQPLSPPVSVTPLRTTYRATTPTLDSATPPTARSLVVRFAEKRYGASVVEVTDRQLQRAQAILDACGGDHDAATTAVDLAATEGRGGRSGFPKHLGGVLEGGYVERARARREEQLRHRDADIRREQHQARRDRYEAWCRHRAGERVKKLSPEARRLIIEERLPAFVEKFRFYLQLRSWSGERIRAWAEPRLLTEYGREGEPTFDAWSKLHDVAATGSFGPNEALQ